MVEYLGYYSDEEVDYENRMKVGDSVENHIWISIQVVRAMLNREMKQP